MSHDGSRPNRKRMDRSGCLGQRFGKTGLISRIQFRSEAGKQSRCGSVKGKPAARVVRPMLRLARSRTVG
jgi:hypothetical protein